MDVVDIAQLTVFVRMVFKDGSFKEEMLKIIPLKGKTRGEDIFQQFKSYVEEMDV